MENNKKLGKTWHPEVLVISGGGVKGIAYIGALQSLLDNGVDVYNIKVYCGSSVGALITTGIIIGYSVEEMKNEMELFSNSIPSALPSIFQEKKEKGDKNKILRNILHDYSISDGIVWDEMIKKLFLKKKINPDSFTFLELRKKTKKDLVISGSNVTAGHPEYFSYRYSPNMLVYDAVRISSRIPIILPVFKHNNFLYVDGDIFDSFPIRGTKKKIQNRSKKGNMIGITILPIDKSYQIENCLDYLYRLLLGAMNYHNSIIQKKYSDFIISIRHSLKATMSINEEEKDNLYNLGYNEGVAYIKKRGKPIINKNINSQKEKT